MESNYGRSNARGVHQGKNRKGAEGPVQFEPATFAEYAVRIDRFQKLTPYNPADAIFTAARRLCADGAASGSLPRAQVGHLRPRACIPGGLPAASAPSGPAVAAGPACARGPARFGGVWVGSTSGRG
jgi:membrane-bound lytic murein transglycosylase B